MSYFSVSDFYKLKFGQKVYKISIDGGCTCPNRDGTKDTRGCIFCSESGSGDFSADKNCSIFEQIEEGKKLIINKMPDAQNGKFIAYFQNFTNTYGNFEKLSAQFLEAANHPEIIGIAIGTRPDCLSNRMLDFLKDLSKKIYIQLEFGLQTSNEKTAEYVRRCYENSIYENTMSRVKKIAPEIHVVTHIIFGLPGETESDMLNTVKFAIDNKTDGIKITCLHVLRGTDLAKDYEEDKFRCLEMDEYFYLIKSALEIIPPNVVVHRLTGDGPKALLIAPLWTANKKRVLNELNKVLRNLL